MFEQYTRPLDDRDIKFLRQEIRWYEREAKAAWRGLPRLVVWFALAGAVVFAIVVWFDLKSAVILACLVAIPIPALALKTAVTDTRRLPEDRANIENAIARNEAKVTRVQSDAVVSFKDPDDLGPMYCYQLEDNRIVTIAGQDFEGITKMPNSDFEAVEILGAKKGFFFKVYRYGQKLKPIRIISVDEARRMRVPLHLEVLEGRLEDLDRLLMEGDSSAT